MKRRLVLLGLVVAGFALQAADDTLPFPANYREWVFLSSGRGMTYGPSANPDGAPQFDNVFVQPEAYREFVKTGKWPDQSMFVLEIRRAATEGSINKGGQFQRDLVAIEVEMKDEKRFAKTGGWAYFEFGTKRDAVAPVPANASCHTCHSQNAAVEHTFVQFYPTLIEGAKAHGTYKER